MIKHLILAAIALIGSAPAIAAEPPQRPYLRRGSAWGGKPPLVRRYRIWPLLSHNPCSGPDRGTGHETPRFHNFTRRRNGWMAIRLVRAAEGDAGDRHPRHRLPRPNCTVVGRVPPGTERNRLCRGTERGDRIPLGGGPL